MSIRIGTWFIAGNAQKTNSDWNATSGYAQILNKPTNLVHTTGNEEINGIKTFSSIPISVTPASTSNDMSVATTQFVVGRISAHNNDTSSHADIRQTLTSTIANITSSISEHNSNILSHSDIRQSITNVSDSITSSIDNHNSNSFSHSDIRQSISTNTLSIAGLTSDLTNETAIRTLDVNNLQQQIDALSSKGDVADIVGTYQDLLNYDTSTLLNKSIIKVLSDSTHDDASSYYKWNSVTSAFTYIGSESPTYNKTEIDEMDDLVVHKAGTENITGTKTFKNTALKGGFITTTSATDTRYFEIQSFDASSNMRGLYQVWRGTSNDTVNIMRALNASGNNCDIRAIVKDDGTTYTYAPNPATASNDNNIATTYWANATGNNIVHLTDNETITGTKTIEDKSLLFKTTSADITTTPSSFILREIYFTDSTNNTDNSIARFGIRMETNGDNVAEVVAQNKTTGTLRKAFLKAVVDVNGNAYTKIDSDAVSNLSLSEANNTTTSTMIPTKGWVNNPATATNVVHRTGDETIAGTKTFSSTINGTAYRAQWGDLAEYYLTDNQYPKGTLVQFGGEKEITVASNKVNAVITSEPGFILNGELEDSQAIALIGRVPVRVIGKVKKFDKISLSYVEGVGCSNNDTEAPIGIALEDKNDSDEGLIICSVKLNFN